MLLAASYYFYMCWKPEYIVLILLSTIIDYFCAQKIAATETKSQKRPWLALSLLTNLGLLFTFKYFNFFNDNAREVFNYLNIMYNVPEFKLLLPVGISFYTFQTLSYTIDVYKGDTPVEKNFGRFALYVSYFPQLVAGPIERSQNLMPQLKEEHKFEYNRVTSGLRLMAWGMFKKVVIADWSAGIVNVVYNNPEHFKGFQVILATFFFAYQIYCDFSGYSDIAIGAARVMGVDLMQNFNRPYFSKSIREFWSRWHISLSTWFRDYLYIPMGGNRVSVPRWYFNLFVTFLVSGIWHGANWTFVMWGALHGGYMVFAIVSNKLRDGFWNITRLVKLKPFYNLTQIGLTFVLVCLGWLFFRANTISDAFLLIKNAVHVEKAQLGLFMFGLDMRETLIMTSVFILFLEVLQWFQEYRVRFDEWIINRPTLLRWSVYVAGVFIILAFGKFDKQEFIYFTF